MGFATNAIHVGQEPDPSTGAVVAPIYQTSTYVYEELGKAKGGYDYARTNHPNRKALERTVAKLEGGHAAAAIADGRCSIALVTLANRPRSEQQPRSLTPSPESSFELRGHHGPSHRPRRHASQHQDALH